jgi:branched-chain amino acid transport system ATP-binding protein
MTDHPALEVTDVSISFGGIQALRDVSVSVPPRARVGLIGPNGAGKTTLVNCIAGGLTPDRGDVRLFGRSIAKLPAPRRARLGIGRTFQNLELFDSMSVLENVTTALDVPLVGTPRRSRDREDRARDALVAFGLEKYAGVPAGTLPYGLRKLLELSRAFVRQPRFLLLDEPVAGLSGPETFLEALVDGLDRLGSAALLIEHDMPTVRELCRHVYVLDSGAVIADGTFAEVARNERVVSAYLGADVDS